MMKGISRAIATTGWVGLGIVKFTCSNEIECDDELPAGPVSMLKLETRGSDNSR